MVSIVGEEIKRILSYNRSIAVLIVFFIFMVFVPTIILKVNLNEVPKGVDLSQVDMFKVFIKIYFFTYTVSLAVFLVHSMSMDTFITDKKERALEALLCSPLSVKEIWMSKVLALFLISYPIALLATMVFVVGSNLMIVGKIYYLPDGLMWIYLFTILPMLTFSVTGISGIWQMVSKRFSAVNFLLFLIAFIIMWVPPFLVSRIDNFNTSTFMWIYSFITLLIIVILIISVRLFLDKERIVLNR